MADIVSKGDPPANSPFEGRNRKCTDIVFLPLIVASWVAMLGVGLAATGIIHSEHLNRGDPQRLVNGMDYMSNICGVSDYVNANGENIQNLASAYFLPSGSAICIEACPETSDLSKFYCKYEIEVFIEEEVATIQALHGKTAANQTRQSLYLYYATTKQCMPQIETRSYLNHCKPTVLLDSISQQLGQDAQNANITNGTEISLAEGNKNGGDFFDETMADAYLVRYIVFGFGLGGAMLLGFAYLLLLRTPGVLATLVWSLIALIFAGFLAGGYYMRETSIRWESEGLKESHEIKGMFWLGMISFTCSALWFVTICCIRKRVSLAIGVVKEASNALSAMPMIMFYPLFQVLCLFAYLIPWGVFMAYLASSGEVQTDCLCYDKQSEISSDITDDLSLNITTMEEELNECGQGCFSYKSFAYTRNTQYAGCFLLFSFFWTSQFIVAVGQLVVAMSTSMWYFTRKKEEVGSRTFIKAIRVSSIYHLGTCAFGSLIIAIIKTIRAVLSWIQRRSEKLQNKTSKIIMKTIQCCIWCLEKCVKFVNKNAYIQTAINGHSFCQGAKEAFNLILRNVLRISAVSLVSDFVLLVGKLFIVVASTVVAYIYMDYEFSDELNGLYMTTILTFLASYATADMFNEVFAMAIATILQCFVIDEEMFDNPQDRFAPESLARTVDNVQESSVVSKVVYPKEDPN